MTKDLQKIIEKISLWNEQFPEKELACLIDREDEAKPLLQSLVQQVLDRYTSLPEDFVGHIYALYLMAQFRDPAGLDLALQFLALPEPYPQALLHEFLTQSFPSVIASCYANDPEPIFRICKNPEVSLLCRTVALVSLSILYHRKCLVRESLVQLFQTLLAEQNPQFLAICAQEIAEMHLGELYVKVRTIYQNRLIDAESFPFKLFETVMQSELINPHRFFLIDDVFEELNGKEYGSEHAP